MDNWTENYCEEENLLLAYNRFMLATAIIITAGGAKNSHQFANVLQSPSQNTSQHQEFLPISRSFTQSIQKNRCNGNGDAVDAFSPSSSESSLVSPMQSSIHDNDLSSNSKSKVKRESKGILNKKR